MDYIEAFKNLKTNNKYSRKSPHKAILLLTVIELYETNTLSENIIKYDDELKRTFQKVWERTLRDETLFHPEVYLPFWYMQNEDFWHIVPNRGCEDILTLLRDNHVKPSEAKLRDCVRYAELDEDLYFLMTLPSGRSSLKRALLETYTSLTDEQIDRLAESADNSIDYSATALSDYEKILSEKKDETKVQKAEADNKLVRQFQKLNEDVQIVMNLQYFSFLKSHRNEREMFKEVCPTVYDLLDKIVNHPVKQGDIVPSFAFIFDNFLSDLRISLMSEEDSMELIDKIGEAIDLLRGNNRSEAIDQPEEKTIEDEPIAEPVKQKESPIITEEPSNDIEIEHVYLDDHGNVIEKTPPSYDVVPERDFAKETRKGQPWTKEEEKQIEGYFQQGKDAKTIAAIIGRTEVAIKSRLAKLGLIDYTYGQDEKSSADTETGKQEKLTEADYTIENSLTRCSILTKYGNRVFSAEGKLRYLGGKLYRLNLKNECFTLKSMRFDGSVWLKGDKKIVAYPRTRLYRSLDEVKDYSEVIEEIIDSPIFEKCRLKVNGVWYDYNGNLITESSTPKVASDESTKQTRDIQEILKNPLYAVRKQAVLRAMGFFRLPAKIKDIARTISRSAWGATIKEDDVEDIINTISDVESVEGKYVLRKKR